jgi:hypothetical protein
VVRPGGARGVGGVAEVEVVPLGVHFWGTLRVLMRIFVKEGRMRRGG